ncbi:MAG: hypothetical protein IBJ00_06015 [Alphaproteobacteria bacterium]|nr:hypothetical protein [Alphaproteobacteria bacterium]
MGILRKGEPYLPPENYESSQDKAMRLYIQKHHELEARRLGQEKEALNLAFEEWKSKLSVEQLGAICPPEYLNDENSPFRNGFLKIHFEKEIWPEIKKLKIIG